MEKPSKKKNGPGIRKVPNKNGFPTYKIFNHSLKLLFTLYVKEKQHIDSVISGVQQSFGSQGTGERLHEESYLKSLTMFVNPTKVVLMPYHLKIQRFTGQPAKPNISSKDRLIFSFRKGRLFIYWMSLTNGKKTIANWTRDPEKLKRWMSKNFYDKASEELKNKRSSFLANILIKKGVECGVIRKAPPKHLRTLHDALAILLFPNFQDFVYEGYRISAVFRELPVSNSKFFQKLRKSSPAQLIRQLFRIRGKKKGFIKAALASLKLTITAKREPGKQVKAISFLQLGYARHLLSSTNSLDHVQNFLNDVTKMYSNASWVDKDQITMYLRNLRELSHAEFMHEGNEKYERRIGQNSYLATFLKNFHPNTQKKFFLEILRDYPYEVKLDMTKEGFEQLPEAYPVDVVGPKEVEHLFADAVRQWNMAQTDFRKTIPLNFDFKNIEELHDVISREYNRLSTSDHDLPVPKRCEELERLSISDSMRLVFPKSKFDLVQWGQKLSNCIASYSDRALKESCLLIGIVKDEKLTYTLEVGDDGSLRQFRAKHNGSAPKEDQEAVEKVLREQRIIGQKGNFGINLIEEPQIDPVTKKKLPYWNYERNEKWHEQNQEAEQDTPRVASSERA